MPRIIEFKMEITDEEVANFLTRMVERGELATGEIMSDDGPADTGAPDVDSAGVAWNAEIHASSKARNADGTWRKKRGVTDAQVAAVTASSAPAPQAQADDAPAPVAPSLPGLPSFPAPVVNEPKPIVTYEALAAKFQEVMMNGKLKMEDAKSVYDKSGVTDVGELTTNESLRRSVMDVLEAL